MTSWPRSPTRAVWIWTSGGVIATPAWSTFWVGEDDEYGHLVHHGGDHWAFFYGGTPEEDEEPIFRFDRHRFVIGEYVSITEHDGVQRTFRVVSVTPVEE